MRNLNNRCIVPVALALCAAAAAGCRAQTIRREQLSESAVVLAIPLVRQDELHECGLASITALCQYWGIAIPPGERQALARTAAEREGLSGGELCAALERLGLETFLFEGSLDRAATGLYRHVDLGRPVLVMLPAGLGGGEGNHYCLVLGYDEPRGNVLLLDPMRGERISPATVFERDWARCRRFMLLASPRSASPSSTESAASAPLPTSNTPSETGGLQ